MIDRDHPRFKSGYGQAWLQVHDHLVEAAMLATTMPMPREAFGNLADYAFDTALINNSVDEKNDFSEVEEA
jgi:hypothetical protein